MLLDLWTLSVLKHYFLQAFHRDDRLRFNQGMSGYHSFSGEL